MCSLRYRDLASSKYVLNYFIQIDALIGTSHGRIENRFLPQHQTTCGIPTEPCICIKV